MRLMARLLETLSPRGRGWPRQRPGEGASRAARKIPSPQTPLPQGERGFRVSLVWAAAALACALALVAGPAAAVSYELAVLQGLDKVTARISTIEAPVGDVVRFGTLEIIARVCDKRPPEETPESASFLDIWEVRRGEPPTSVFRGWMFASSPALSALEHPVYDVWVLDCRNNTSGQKK